MTQESLRIRNVGLCRVRVTDLEDAPWNHRTHPVAQGAALAMKPVELYANACQNNSDAGDVVFDGYSGSGTAIIAAEQIGRLCRSIELEPKYCDVAVQRWEKLTGKKAEVQHG